jgi:hypothetical protein
MILEYPGVDQPLNHRNVVPSSLESSAATHIKGDRIAPPRANREQNHPTFFV